MGAVLLQWQPAQGVACSLVGVLRPRLASASRGRRMRGQLPAMPPCWPPLGSPAIPPNGCVAFLPCVATSASVQGPGARGAGQPDAGGRARSRRPRHGRRLRRAWRGGCELDSFSQGGTQGLWGIMRSGSCGGRAVPCAVLTRCVPCPVSCCRIASCRGPPQALTLEEYEAKQRGQA